MSKKICVYSSSSDVIEPVFFETAKKLAELMAKNKHSLVYGGGNVGLMGEMAKTIHAFGGKVIGVIPEKLRHWGLAYEQADELIVTKCMRERKATMEEHADAFIALPGGFGTLEELFEVITLKQLHYHNKPIVILDVDNFYKPLVELLDHIYEHRFAKKETRDSLYYITSDVKAAIAFIEGYVPAELAKKWY